MSWDLQPGAEQGVLIQNRQREREVSFQKVQTHNQKRETYKTSKRQCRDRQPLERVIISTFNSYLQLAGSSGQQAANTDKL